MSSVDKASLETGQGIIYSEWLATRTVSWKALQLPPVAQVDRVIELSPGKDVPFIWERQRYQPGRGSFLLGKVVCSELLFTHA